MFVFTSGVIIGAIATTALFWRYTYNLQQLAWQLQDKLNSANAEIAGMEERIEMIVGNSRLR